ncbi:hypothetical protein [Kitasatospora sp. GP82]|uniref:hypothetical protein n=1 Tax=Kitasatospora sp. GP82 TaxID=3035089 RepID=UPI002475FDD9|nr:hypothetical protein [Kitasatospora sp. GP82]MDH6126392.1 hypothetical protein [Kitasatospora sp. GP82]
MVRLSAAEYGGFPAGATATGMGRRRFLVGLAAGAPLVLAGCGGSKGKAAEAPVPTATPSSAPSAVPARTGTGDTTVMIIRHGEKPDGSHPGLDENGRGDGHSLTDRGWQRARALPQLFDPAGRKPLTAGLVRPARIYAATDQGPHAGAHRMRQTVTPLAAHLGLTVDTTYAESQEAALATAAVSVPGPVLICWEHSRIPAIVNALGASHTGVPGTWPDRFDLVWVFTRTGGTWSFRQVSQQLLDGDR